MLSYEMSWFDCYLSQLKFNSVKFGCKSYVYIGFDRPAILENRGEIRTITKLDDDLNPCNSTKTCSNQIYKLQLPSTGKLIKMLITIEELSDGT